MQQIWLALTIQAMDGRSSALECGSPGNRHSTEDLLDAVLFQRFGSRVVRFTSGSPREWKQTLRLAAGDVLGCSRWIFVLANCTSAAGESGFSNSPFKCWRCCSSTPV